MEVMSVLVALLLTIGLLSVPAHETAASSFSAETTVYFSPDGGATAAIVRELGNAQHRIMVQAYSFTSAPIAKALLDAHKRGVKMLAVLDKSNQTDKYSAATFLENAGIPVLIDAEHAIAHNKVIVIDNSTVLTGSFNFSKAAEEKNAENLLVLKKSPELAHAYVANINAHAAHSHPYQRTITKMTPERERATLGEIHGNRKSNIYHLPGCAGYARISLANRVPFTSEREAVAAGYHKARNCR
jgi:phosphatidylserine/phosphatidylglycerophosphate/cardiolipin synthase-like enzyme